MRSSVPVSIIIPAWNGMSDLPACLAALNRQSGIEFEIIVVDNASTDSTAGYITQNFPHIRLQHNSVNCGFVSACNDGLRMARGEILVLLNQDTEVFPNWLVALVTPLLTDGRVGITGSKALFSDGTIQHAGGYIDDRGVGHSYAYRAPDHQNHTPRAVHYVSGASLAITRKTYETIGGLDESFAPAYYEDTDLCRRARRAGLSVRYVPDSVLLHKERSVMLNREQHSHRSLARLQRNRLRYILKHWSIDDIAQRFFPAECAWFDTLGWRGESLVTAAQDAYLWHLLHLSTVLEARRAAIPTSDHDAEMLSLLLLQLRLRYPLAPAALTNTRLTGNTFASKTATPSEDAAPTTPCEPPQSTRGLYGYLRQRWPNLSLAAVTWPLARGMARVTHRQLLAEVLLEYTRENSREIGRLAREIDSLRRRLNHQSRPNAS